MELIKDKVAIVTGAAAGIGAGTAALFAENGAHVFLADLNGAQAEKTAAALRAKGGSAFAFEAHAGVRDHMTKVVKDAISRFGRIDILINNAGNDRRPVGHNARHQPEERLSLHKTCSAPHG
jgi:meso-butanediol dehydrogenase/(S,S)-butanediol dehydrogenase/diacetyl reductase